MDFLLVNLVLASFAAATDSGTSTSAAATTSTTSTSTSALAYTDEYTSAAADVMVNPSNGEAIFAKAPGHKDFRKPSEAYHVGIH